MSDASSTGGKGAQTRRSILDAAIARFGRDGFRATSVADIARDAGVGGTVAYAYFPSKEALFLAALDEDAAAVIHEGLDEILAQPDREAWRETLIVRLVTALDLHPLARRIIAGLEPDVTERVVDIPALTELRKALGERLRSDQVEGLIRRDVDPVVMASGVVAIVIPLLMAVVQLGAAAASVYAGDVVAVFEAALSPPVR
ncbi:MAG: TetR/AcrR family transcriptional regulator [Acidimicrobiales bacterium]